MESRILMYCWSLPTLVEVEMKPKLIMLFLLGEVLGLVGAGVAMFWSAGRLDWWPGWAVLFIWVVWFALENVVLLRFNPALMAERLTPPQDSKNWDRTLLSLIRLFELARYILAGLDQRYGWTEGFSGTVQLLGGIVCMLSAGLFAWAMASNPFFSQVVRIQVERGHRVAMGGPYRFVRHPGYTSMVFFEIALSLVLASWWAILAGGVCALLFILRTALEDQALQNELSGYREYAQRVRYRLVPGLW